MNKEELYIFDWLTKEEISYFILMSETRNYKKWDTILKEWDESDDTAFIIEKWSVSIIRDQEKVATLGAWDIFWEMALITSEPRTATVIADDDLEVLALQKDDFLALYQKSWRYQEIKDRILERIKDNFYGIKR